ncbi:MAG: HIT family protein [Bacteroidota bacterium]
MTGSADCAFCRIIRGEAPACVVHEDGAILAFLDARPLFPGHCLVVPRQHHPNLLELPPELLAPLFGAAQALARAVEEALGAQGSFVAVNNRVSQSVPHLHVHVVPRRRGDGLKGFFWPRRPYRDEDEMRAVQEALRRAVARHVPAAGPGAPAGTQDEE